MPVVSPQWDPFEKSLLYTQFGMVSVLRYDVRKQMKLLAAQYGFSNHDSKFSESSSHQQGRFWHGYYKHGRLAAFIMAEAISSEIVTWHFAGSLPALSVALQILNAFFILFTAWCMK